VCDCVKKQGTHNELQFDIPEFGTQKPRKVKNHPMWSETY
jgi:hypothetical protein